MKPKIKVASKRKHAIVMKMSNKGLLDEGIMR